MTGTFRRGLLALGLVCMCRFAISAGAPIVEGQILVRFSHDVGARGAMAPLNREQFEIVRAVVPELHLYLVKLKGGMRARSAVSLLSQMDDVVYAQPDHVVTLRERTPDDGEFIQQWGLRNPATNADIRAPQAWDVGTGGKDTDGNDIVVAVVDGGMDVSHEDLKPNLWTNTLEIDGNGVDDDGNGYVDDIHGWNAYGHNGQIPANAHGTHVAGIAGASGNNGHQVTGVNWEVKLMAVAASSGTTSVVAEGYGYVLAQKKLWLRTNGQKGANVVVTNSSFGVDEADCTSGEYPVWNDLYDAMGEAGILSAAATANANLDIDVKGDVPTSCASKHLITVTNTDRRDAKNIGAGFGKVTIDLGAPGTEVLSTLPNNKTGKLSGTSMATPHVAGAVALLHSLGSAEFQRLRKRNPGAANQAIKAILMEAVDVIPALKDVTVSGGRLNLGAAAQGLRRFRE